MGRRRKHHKSLPRRVYVSHGQYFFVDRTGKWNPLGRSMREMYLNMARFYEDQSPLTTMAALFNRYELTVLPKKAEKTQSENSRSLKRLKAVFGEMDPRDVRPSDIYAYRDKRGRTTEIGANRDLEVLSHVFTKSVEWGAAETNPCRDVRKFSEPRRERYVTDAEYQAVYELASPMMQVAMGLALLTGLRRGDLLSLTRDHLIDDGILIKTSKTGKPLLIEWSDELRGVIDRAKRIKPQVRRTIICNKQGKAYTGHGFSAMWQRLIRNAVEKKVIQERFRFHDLRAKSASDDSLEAATQRLGHMDAKLTERVYRRKPRRVKPLR